MSTFGPRFQNEIYRLISICGALCERESTQRVQTYANVDVIR